MIIFYLAERGLHHRIIDDRICRKVRILHRLFLKVAQSLYLKYTCGKRAVSNSSSLYALFYSVIYNSVGCTQFSLEYAWTCSYSLLRLTPFHAQDNKVKCRGGHLAFCSPVGAGIVILSKNKITTLINKWWTISFYNKNFGL